LRTEIASDRFLAGQWAEALQIVDELVPSFERSPFWIEPQTRVCRARILIAQDAVPKAVADADRSAELSRTARLFQSLCDPLAFRARLHAELGELDAAARITLELLDEWRRTRSGYNEQWVIDAWFAAWRTGNEERLQSGIDALHMTPWMEAAASLIRRDFDDAATRLETIGAVSIAAHAHLWAAEWLDEHGRRPEANSHLDRSLAFWRSVGATRYAQRSESLLAA